MADSEDRSFKVGARVVVKEKGLEGIVRYVGMTSFAPGKWVGVELGEASGKNNGTVKGKVYFTCPENCGLFVRQNQLQLVASKSPSQSRIPAPSNIPTASLPGTSSHLKRPSSGGKRSPSGKRSPRPGGSPPTAKHATGEPKPQALVAAVTTTFESQKPAQVSDEVTDLQERLALLQQKRVEDKARIKELEKYRAQLQQMMEYKQRWSESQTELSQLLKTAKKECREAMLAKEKAEEELRELSDTVEMATLDKEMAEERCESLQAESEALKEKVEELTIDLEIIKQEISESGMEGAAASAQFKQLEQQNNRLKEALVRLRDLSAQDKFEHQRVVKDLERISAETNHLREQKEKLEQDIQESETIIDELKEQVDAALGAEEMVEKLTDKNLELEEKIEQLSETVTDLEALRDLSEEQEELRMEVEHDLREEVDMGLNSVRQMERKLDAAQEVIVDQEQTIEKFRELVRHLQADILELRERGESQQRGGESRESIGGSASPVMNLSVQLKSSTIKAHSRTVEFELRKFDAQQATEQINYLKSFMPNSFLISGGDYDALLVLMLLPRLIFKADLVIDQLKQQRKLDETLGSLSTVSGPQADQLAFTTFLIYKLATLQLFISKANRILGECDVQLYRQMGGLRDDLSLHERSLDVLIELLKKEKLDESVPLHGVEKAINHFENLLQTRLVYEPFVGGGRSEQLLDEVKVMCAGCDFVTMELLRLRGLAPEGDQFVAQVKELESFNNDLRQACRKIRRKVPAQDSQRTLKYDTTIALSLEKTIRKQLLLIEAFKALHLKASMRAHSLTDGEHLTSGELDEFVRQVATSGVLHELASGEGASQQPRELLRAGMSTNSSTLERFLSALQEGEYDAAVSKVKPDQPVVVRGRAVKAELSDVEGLGFKLEERQKDILELKKTIKLKAQELSEANVKIGLLEKKVESADAECVKKVQAEREEVEKFKAAFDEQERKFSRTIEILQGDIENLEHDKQTLEKRLDIQTKKTMLSDISAGRRTLGGRGSPYSSPFGSPFSARKGPLPGAGGGISPGTDVGVESADGSSGEGAEQMVIQNSPLLLARIESLTKALDFSQGENFRLKAQIARSQLNSLPPLSVPKRLIHKWREEGRSGEGGGSEGEEGETVNQTDQEKSVVKETDTLLEELKKMATSLPVVDFTKKEISPREQLVNQITKMVELQHRKQRVLAEGRRLLASHYPGGLVSTKVATFAAPRFTKALSESSQCVMSARLRLPTPSGSPFGHRCVSGVQQLVLSPAQFTALHSTIVT